jgi:glycogen debranching enzyme
VAVTLHEGTSFVVCDERGDFEPDADGGFFYLDTRFLSRHELRIDGAPPIVLQATTPHANEAFYFLVNPALRAVPRSTVAITVHRTLGDGLREEIAVESFADQEAQFALSLRFEADFAYILTVKRHALGTAEDARPPVHAELLSGREVVLAVAVGGTPHRTTVSIDPAPASLSAGEASFDVRLRRRERWRAIIEVTPSPGERHSGASASPEHARVRSASYRRSCDALRDAAPRLSSDHAVLEAAYARASEDLASLRIKAEGGSAGGGGGDEYAIAAGIPWYMALFGRDSLVSSFEAMLLDPTLARGTIDALARLQGKKRDPVTEEAPGKILHEYRLGPLTPAARKLIPSYPYYGSIDATALFVVVLCEYVRVTGDLEFARERWDAVRAALEWTRRWGDRDGDGLLEYERDSDVGLVNQGWKDSGDSVRFRDGTIATGPIALVEVQGYTVDARRRAADLARRIGETRAADRLEHEARALADAIAERYWLEDRAFFAEALDGAKRKVDALTSNPGHLLWSGALARDAAAAVARALLGPELFSGFGVRTMGEREGAYNPVSYHNGTVWPHDSALALAGLVRYGLRDEAARLAAGLLSALAAFPDHRPPELFCGHGASEVSTPVVYPTACSPQAWASAAVVYLLQSVVGLDVDCLERRVRIAPLVMPGLTRIDWTGVPAGRERIDVSVRVDAETASAEVSLPYGWKRVEG